MALLKLYNKSYEIVHRCGFVARISFATSAGYLLVSYPYTNVLSGIWRQHTTPGGTFGLSEYVFETIFSRYRSIHLVWGGYPIDLDPAVLFLTVATAALLGVITGRISPAFFGFVFTGKSDSRRKFERGLWRRAKRQRRQFSWKTVLLTGVLIGSIGAGIGILIDWQIFAARLAHYNNPPVYKMINNFPEGCELNSNVPIPIPRMPNPIGRGWFTLADGAPILSAVFIAGFCAVVIPARRAMRAGGCSADPRCACCGYPLPPPSAQAASICPECGYANPSLMSEQGLGQEPPGIEN